MKKELFQAQYDVDSLFTWEEIMSICFKFIWLFHIWHKKSVCSKVEINYMKYNSTWKLQTTMIHYYHYAVEGIKQM